MTSTTPSAPPEDATEAEQAAPAGLERRRAPNRTFGGVCGGLGRYYDLDPLIFRVVLGVLAITGGLGLVAYGILWLVLPLEGDRENEARRLLSGRVEGQALTALLFMVVGCGLFLSMLNRGGVLTFAAMLALVTAGAAYWSRHRRETETGEIPTDEATAHAVADAPPETAPPPVPKSPSWWRDPLTKDGTTGYLWGPDDDASVAAASRWPSFSKLRPAARNAADRGPAGIGGWTFLAALVIGAAAGAIAWESEPQPTALAIGLATALGVFGLGFVISAWYGRTGGGTVVWALITTALLAGTLALPNGVKAEWLRETWRPAAAADVHESYELGTGEGRLDLSALELKKGESVPDIKAEVGAGRLHVIVPDDMRIEVRADVGVGDLQLPLDTDKNVDVRPDQKEQLTIHPRDGGKPRGTLNLDLEVGVGQLEVDRATPTP
ncbi:PspC domain-containing protein [Streptomyces sp. A7024]|uniref:PspC domain-containing protein n=1 Tax=Streptomyces coryli TaxID=1128680 RepID=A0A6G4U7F4_9ACTN|nr:PspC domain-containing protein [Streptomyces coryli]NGN67318.1 PspC domain-containing protein [Streptomyces coryli]